MGGPVFLNYLSAGSSLYEEPRGSCASLACNLPDVAVVGLLYVRLTSTAQLEVSDWHGKWLACIAASFRRKIEKQISYAWANT